MAACLVFTIPLVMQLPLFSLFGKIKIINPSISSNFYRPQTKYNFLSYTVTWLRKSYKQHYLTLTLKNLGMRLGISFLQKVIPSLISFLQKVMPVGTPCYLNNVKSKKIYRINCALVNWNETKLSTSYRHPSMGNPRARVIDLNFVRYASNILSMLIFSTARFPKPDAIEFWKIQLS